MSTRVYQKRLLQVTRKQRIAYFTAGHEERTDAPASQAPQVGGRRRAAWIVVAFVFTLRIALPMLPLLIVLAAVDPRKIGVPVEIAPIR